MNKRICFFVYGFPPDFSGATLQTLELAHELKRRDVELFFVSYTYKQEYLKNNEYQGFTCYRFLRDKTYDLLKYHVRMLLTLLKHRKEFDILYLNGNDGQFWTPFYLILFCRLFNKQYFMELNMEHYGKDPICINSTRFAWLKRKVARLAKQYISNSKAISKSFDRENLGSEIESLVYYGIDTDKFKIAGLPEEKIKLREKLGIPKDKIIIMTCGGISKRKGVDFLLECWPEIKNEIKDAVMIFIGPYDKTEDYDQEFTKRIVESIKSGEYGGSVILTGSVNNVNEYLAASDMFVFASRQEGSPSAIREAMSASLPVVSLELLDITREMIDNGVNGIVIPITDQDEFRDWGKRNIADPSIKKIFVNEVVSLVRDEKRRKEYGMCSRQTIIEKFSIEKKADIYLEMFSK